MAYWIQNWFSNMKGYITPMKYQDIIYNSPEHFYQAMKCTDLEYRRLIASAPYPAKAKKEAHCLLKSQYQRRSDWENIQEKVMEYAVRWRCEYEPLFLQQLLNTEGEIVEWNNWHDQIWGKCICSSCNSQGLNLLGNVLMKLREEYQNK